MSLPASLRISHRSSHRSVPRRYQYKDRCRSNIIFDYTSKLPQAVVPSHYIYSSNNKTAMLRKPVHRPIHTTPRQKRQDAKKCFRIPIKRVLEVCLRKVLQAHKTTWWRSPETPPLFCTSPNGTNTASVRGLVLSRRTKSSL